MIKKRITKRIAAVVLIVTTLGIEGCGKEAKSAQPPNSEYIMAPVRLEDMEPSEDETIWETYNRYMDENRLPGSIMNHLDQFAYNTCSALLKTREENLNYSPLSLYYALSMAAAGAEGETFEQMSDLLGIEDSVELTEACSKIYRNIYYSNEMIENRNEQNNTPENKAGLYIAHSLWADREIPVKDNYVKQLSQDFYASVYKVSFKEDQTWKEMSRWIKENTNEVLEPEILKDEDTLLTLINTLYYYGAWIDTFPHENTKTDTFTKADGSIIETDFMERTTKGQRFYEGEDYLSAAMNTRTGASVVFAIPKEGHQVDDLFSTPEKLKVVLNSPDTDAEIHWRVPKYSFGSSMDMKEVLQRLGIDAMFSEGADFKGMADREVKVSRIIQETHIGIDESGVEGAAYTMVAFDGAAPLPETKKAEMILERPFIYGIHDENAGWLFIGVVDDPVHE